MTTDAIDRGGIYAKMGLLERIAVCFMAFVAESMQRLTQQRYFFGKMRFMAAEAIPGCRRMDLFIIHFLLDVLVTGETKFRTRRHKQGLQLRFMRIMALGALTFHHRSMPAL